MIKLYDEDILDGLDSIRLLKENVIDFLDIFEDEEIEIFRVTLGYKQYLITGYRQDLLELTNHLINWIAINEPDNYMLYEEYAYNQWNESVIVDGEQLHDDEFITSDRGYLIHHRGNFRIEGGFKNE